MTKNVKGYILLILAILLSTWQANSQERAYPIVPNNPENGDIISLYHSQDDQHYDYAIYDSFTVKGIAGVLVDIEQCYETKNSLFQLVNTQESIIENKEKMIDNLKVQNAVSDEILSANNTFIASQEEVIKDLRDERKKKMRSTTAKDIAFSLVIIGLSISTIVLGAK